jgi:hypothetical protein
LFVSVDQVSLIFPRAFVLPQQSWMLPIIRIQLAKPQDRMHSKRVNTLALDLAFTVYTSPSPIEIPLNDLMATCQLRTRLAQVGAGAAALKTGLRNPRTMKALRVLRPFGTDQHPAKIQVQVMTGPALFATCKVFGGSKNKTRGILLVTRIAMHYAVEGRQM